MFGREYPQHEDGKGRHCVDGGTRRLIALYCRCLP